MTNPILRSGLFATPDSFDKLSEMIESIGNAEEKRMAWLGATLALNLCHKLVEDQADVLVNSSGVPI